MFQNIMTFPSTVKKSGSVTISKTASGSKTLPPGSPRSPGSPLSPSPKVISGPSVKKPMITKASEKVNDELSTATSVKKPLVVTKGRPALKSVTKPNIDSKPEPTKVEVSTIKLKTKTINKPPPLQLNIKATVTKGGLLSPAANPKTPTTSSVKSPALVKSPMVTKSVPATKAPSVKSSTSPVIKSSQALTNSSLVSKSSQMTSGSKSSTTSSLVTKSLTLKTSAVSSTTNKFPQVSPSCKSVGSSSVAKSLSTSAISKTSTMTSTVPKSPLSIKPSTSTLKSIPSKTVVKDQTTMKSTTQTKVAVSTKSEAGVKLTTTSSNKGSSISRSPSTTSSIKPITTKMPTSPSKPLTKEPISGKVSILVKSAVIKSNTTSKSGPTSPKVVKKESSSLSLLSVKSSSSIKSTSSVVSKTTLQTKITPASASKNLVPKSPVTKTQSLALSKPPLSPTAKTTSSPILKTKTPSTPTVKTRTPSLSTVKPPLSPAIKKMVPTKLVLSPGPTKSFSSTRLGSVSTESLALKSPMSPKPAKVVTKNLSTVNKIIEKQIVKGIRGGQPIKKTIDIPGITQLSSNINLNEQDVKCKIESTAKNELSESMINQIPEQDLVRIEESKINEICVNVDMFDRLEVVNNFINDDMPLNVTINQSVDQLLNVQDSNVESKKENSIEVSSKLPILEQNQKEDIGNVSFDYVIVEKKECEPCLTSITQSANNIAFDDGHFDLKKKKIIFEHLNETQPCVMDNDDHFELMNDKLILGDVPFESDISDNEQTAQKETIENNESNADQQNCIDDVFLPTESLSSIDFDRADSTEDFLHQFMPKSIEQRSEGTLSISTDDGSLLSRKSYSEVVLGSTKDSENYFDYDIDMVDDSLDYDNEERSVFVEMTEKEFPELKPKNVSTKRRRNKKQKKRSYSNRSESQSGK